MSHSTVREIYADFFPDFAKNETVWFPNGRNSIRSRLSTGAEYIFTFNSTRDWKLETVDSFLDSRKEN